MTTSQNGWSASPHLKLRPLVVNGVAFAPGIRDDENVAYIFEYFWSQYAKRVEPLRNPGCWGFYYRENRNDPNSLSNHSSATATDGNAPAHPNGVATSKTFTPAQIAEIHKILAECHGALRWGGDYTHTIDAMHVEINVSPARLAEIVTEMKTAARKAALPKRPDGVQDTIDAARKAKAAARKQKRATRAQKLQGVINVLRGLGGKK